MYSLGFDTLIINSRPYDDESIDRLVEIFSPLDVRRFVFLHDFDPHVDPLALSVDSARSFQSRVSARLPRGIHAKAFFTLKFTKDTVITPEILRLCISRGGNSLFVSLPMFPDTSDNDFAVSLNRLIYRSKMRPVFSSFESVRDTSQRSFSDKLLAINSCKFALDINYLLRPDNHDLASFIIHNNVQILPCISHDPSCYAGIQNAAQHYVDTYGKQEYYKLCSQINKCISDLGL